MAPLKDQKHFSVKDYLDEKVRLASKRAKALLKSADEKYPLDFGSHSFRIIDKIVEMIPVENAVV